MRDVAAHWRRYTSSLHTAIDIPKLDAIENLYGSSDPPLSLSIGPHASAQENAHRPCLLFPKSPAPPALSDVVFLTGTPALPSGLVTAFYIPGCLGSTSATPPLSSPSTQQQIDALSSCLFCSEQQARHPRRPSPFRRASPGDRRSCAAVPIGSSMGCPGAGNVRRHHGQDGGAEVKAERAEELQQRAEERGVGGMGEDDNGLLLAAVGEALVLAMASKTKP
ncbi:hypothetical protein U9M48_030752 [Paspalum notatum var. saurae]|uniref:Uncharacterized protein n=1 Tax=Paspalum notatum var. saurae TaxID=547442 RepID=A0AAQ3U134_PASNO